MERKTGREKPGKRHRGRFVLIIIFLLSIAAGVLLYLWKEKPNHKQSQPQIVTESQLEEIINVSELSTFTAVYNGVAQVMNKEKPEETDYYVSYEARVDVGIDFSEIDIDIDNETGVIWLKLPEMEITNTTVDITSLDYIFVNDKANTVFVSQEAYRICEEDAKNESAGKEEIFDLARQNAENVVRALTCPLVEQSGFTVKIK